MKKFLPFSKRQPSLDRFAINRGGWSGSDRFSVKSLRRTSATSLNPRSILIVRGAYNIDLNKVDSSFTKLHKACLLNDDVQVKKHLLKVDNNSHDSSNRYPLHLATVNGNFAIVKLLVENSANPNVQDNEGNTPLIKSIECGHEHLVKYLLNNGADPNISDMDNNTALHWAIMTESTIAVDALISSKKCDLTLRNNKDETCLHLAVRSSMISLYIFESMIRDGADVDAKDQLGLTAFEIAQASNNKTAINAFSRHTSQNNDSQADSSQNTSNLVEEPNHKSSIQIPPVRDDYRIKYIRKNRENLEYERRLIHLNSLIEQLKVDMSYMKEQNDKLESDYEKLLAENSKLKDQNNHLLDQINRITHKESELSDTDYDTNKTAMPDDKKAFDHNNVQCMGHEEFLAAKAFLQERINKLKFGLTHVQL